MIQSGETPPLPVQASAQRRGRLKIFLGAAPGVGKTFEMLSEAGERVEAGVDVAIAVIETHGRADTAALAAPFPVVPRRAAEGTTAGEMDLDAVLARRPGLALVDDLHHANAQGGRHPRRWQDVLELLGAGIDVHATLNIQHVESLTDIAAGITRVPIADTVPDSIFEGAEIEIVDLPPDELIERLAAGKVHVPEAVSRHLQSYFSRPSLYALRELTLRRAAQSVDREMLALLDAQAVPGAWAAGERVLVAVSEQPGGDRLIRIAKRLADALHAPWYAAVIDTPRSATFGAPERVRIADYLRLATSLGATIARAPADNVAAGLLDQIETMRATQLVIGRSRRSWWFEARHGSVVEHMLKEGPQGLAVHVIPAAERAARTRRDVAMSALTGAWGSPSDYAMALLLVALTTALDQLAAPFVGEGALDLIYLLPVIVVAARFGLRPGLFASVVAGLAYNFFFLPPLFTFTIADPQSLLTMLVLIAIAALTSQLTGRLRARATLSARSAAENAAVAGFAQALARSSTWQETAATVCDEAALLLDCDTLLLNERAGELTVMGAHPEAHPLGPVDRAAAEWCWTRGDPAGRGTATLNAADWQFHPLKTALGTLAVLGLARADGHEPVAADRGVLLATLIGQAALAHERLALESDMREVSMLKERDRLRGDLLSSIGRDLRSPIEAVSDAVETLAAQAPDTPAVPVARAELQRLRRFLDNLFDMMRLDSGAVPLETEAVDLAEAVSGAVHDMRDTLAACPIRLAVPPDLPRVRADPRLLHPILTNLLANAAHHGAGKITVEAMRVPDAILLTIRDRGPGIEEGAEERIFETFAQGAGGEERGDGGLGLAIVKGFADALGITVTAGAAPDGGAAFTLRFGDEAVIRP